VCKNAIVEQQEKSFIPIGNYVIQKSNKYGLKQFCCMRNLSKGVVYVIQKSNKYGLKQCEKKQRNTFFVVYVIQKSNKYGLKQ